MAWLRLRVFMAAACASSTLAWAGDIAGRATVIDGDTLEIHGTKIRLLGIDAVEAPQKCGSGSDQWPCGRRAAFALSDLIGEKPLRCEPRDRDRYGRTVAMCFLSELDVNEWMVRQGWAVAYARYSTAYVEVEATARAARRNIWSGEFTRPDEYRRGGSNAAVSSAPSACAIKGSISEGAKVYHLPGSEWYGRTRIDTSKGERWFCSEQEAIAAGWRSTRGARSR
jgi:endonuclease YncB( thermonuclease family)